MTTAPARTSTVRPLPHFIRRDWFVATLLTAVCFSAFLVAPVHQIFDSRYITVVSDSLLSNGTLRFPDDFRGSDYRLQEVEGRTYHFFSSAPAILNAPIVLAFRLAGTRPIQPDGTYLPSHESKILRIAAALTAALTCLIFYLIARTVLDPAWSAGIVLIFAFGTQLFSTVSRAYWSHAWAVLLCAAAIYVVHRPRWRERAWPALLGASLISWAFFCRPAMAVAVLGLSVWMLLERRRHFPIFIGTGLIWLALLITHSTAVYGDILPPYFFSDHLKTGRLGITAVRTQYFEAVTGTLFSPGKGLLIYLPFLIAVAVLLWRFRRVLPEKRLLICALGVCVAHWQLISLFRNWWGGAGFGPRLFSDILPWLFVLTVATLPAWKRSLQEAGPRSRWVRIALVAMLVATSVFIHTRGATAVETLNWESRPVSADHEDRIALFRNEAIWDWRYPQFVVGLIPRPLRQHPLVAQIQKQIDNTDAAEVAATRREIAEWVTSSRNVPGRIELREGVGALGLSAHGVAPGNTTSLLVLLDTNPAAATSTQKPKIRITVFSEDESLPVDVHIDDGLTDHLLQFTRPETQAWDLSPLQDDEKRLVMIRSAVSGTDPAQVQRSVAIKIQVRNLHTPETRPAHILEPLRALQTAWDPEVARDLSEELLSLDLPTTCTSTSDLRLVNVHRDCWTVGSEPLAILVTNETGQEGIPHLEVVDRLAFEGDDSYLYSREGDEIRIHAIAGNEISHIRLKPVASGESRIFVLWTDRSREASGENSRTVGVRLKSVSLRNPQASQHHGEGSPGI